MTRRVSGVLSASDPRDEERHARARRRQLEALHRAAQAAAEKRHRERQRELLRETRERWPKCRCPIRCTTTGAELQALGAGCTDPLFCCPRLDAVRRRLGR